ncbi:Arginine methyltransferase 7 [Carabus blaptoides fortunei]
MHSENKKANVLDIGTGTGLLSMMAVKCGADSVTACEAFKPVAQCAKQIMRVNGFADTIKLIAKNSLDLNVGSFGDMKQKANILVTEVFDTELIGEGAIQIFEHAHKELLEENCIVVPDSATILRGEVIPDSVQKCVGSPAIHDIQLSQFPVTHFKTIISPTPVIRFDWSGKTTFMKKRNNLAVQKAEQNGTAQVVFMWWDLNMDGEGKIILSCAPYWAHPDIEHHSKNSHSPMKDSIPWRDHWMQAIYFLPNEMQVTKGQELTLVSNHDEYSLWFNIKDNLQVTDMDYAKPLCQCGLHFVFSRTRIGQLNDSRRNKKYLAVLRNKITPDTICLCLSEGSLLGLLAAKMGAKKVYCVSNMNMIQVAFEEFAKQNEIKDRVVFLDDLDEVVERQDEMAKVNLIIGEPFFAPALLPWHNLHFMHAIKKDLHGILPANVAVMPQRAVVNAMAVNFNHLHKIKASLNICEGFDMKFFDEMIKNSSDKADVAVEPQPLWEYTGSAVSLPFAIMEFNVESYNPLISKEAMGQIKFPKDATLNGIAVWIDWYLDGSSNNIVTTGPIMPPEIHQEIKWDMYTRQGVYLLRHPITIKQNDTLHYTVFFSTQDDQFEFRLNGKRI